MVRSRGAPAALGLGIALFGCQEQERPLPLAPETGGDAGFQIDAGGGGCGPAEVTPSSCGGTTVSIELSRQNLYFLLDRSGSMGDLLEGSSFDKYDSARFAIGNLLFDVGHRVFYGAAVFPGNGNDAAGCDPGFEVFGTRQGDTLGSGCDGGSGATLLALQRALGGFSAYAGTPVAATLSALAPALGALPGKTALILATDGAPNCNPNLRCAPSDCMLNIEHATLNGRACDDTFNCCDPQNLRSGPYSCVDRAESEAQIAALLANGIPTYVIGMPGSELYASVLTALATAGGTARQGGTAYYAARDTAELGSILEEIGAAVTVSCSIDLASVPVDRDLVNVYFDTRIVPADPVDGWSWSGDQSIALAGSACAELEAGDVRQVQVLFGCPTTIE